MTDLAALVRDDTHRLAWIRKQWVTLGEIVELPNGLRSYGVNLDANGDVWELVEHSSLPVTTSVSDIPRLKVTWANIVLKWEAA